MEGINFMSMTSENNKRIAKNTLFLYVRMLLIMAVTLYTSRVVLQVLGVEDYGIYNVVGGIVTVLGFLNNSMLTSTQRYLTFELGCENYKRFSEVFSVSLLIHCIIALLVVVLAETIGLWFFYTKMTIPIERMDAALWVFHFSVMSIVVTFMSIPYNACIIAYEKMSTFAYISILEAILKLVIVFFLTISNIDRLKLYAILMFLVQLCIRLVYSCYCNIQFKEAKFRKVTDYSLLREMLGFAGWNLWGSCAGIAFTQGLNILLNMFFNPIVNAARSIAVQVQGAVVQFTHNFQTAMNPQIIKSYAQGNLDYMHSLICRSSKFTFFLIFALSLPVFIETENLLKIWLAYVPMHTVPFIRIILCVSIFEALSNPFVVSVQATGKVKFYQVMIGSILMTILPISYVVLRLGGNPESVFFVQLCVCIIAFIVRVIILRSIIGLSVFEYFKRTILPCALVCICSCIISYLIKLILPSSLIITLVNCVINFVLIVVVSYYLGLTLHERMIIKNKLKEIVYKFVM